MPCLSVLVHDRVEHFAARTDAVERQRRERLVDQVQLRQKSSLSGSMKRMPVANSPRACRLVHQPHRRELVGRVVVLGDLLQDTASIRRAS